MAQTAKVRENETITIGDTVEFKIDYEGHGTVLGIRSKRDFLGTVHTDVTIDVGEGHHGYDFWSSEFNANVVVVPADRLWKA